MKDPSRRDIMRPVNQRVVIVGAGICGLTLGYHLARAGIPVTLLEKEAAVGGLARGYRYGDHAFDIGPHRFYSPVPHVMDFINEVLGSDTSQIARISSVHFLGKYHLWPLRLSTLFRLPPTVSAQAFVDLVRKGRDFDPDNPSFENYILGRYGRTLYRLFFKGYTEKFLGIPAATTHSNWAKIGVERATIDEKVNTATISHLVKLMLIPKQRELTFVYPPGGVHVFCEKLRASLLEMGAEVRTGVVPTSILSTDGEIRKIITTDGVIDAQYLVWTAPLDELCAMLGLPDPSLDYLALLLYNVTTRKPPRQDVQWCYYGAEDLIFSRISYPTNFHAGMAPAGRGSLCVEVTCREGDDRWQHPERLTAAVRRDLVKTDVIGSEADIDEVHIERVPHAYPVYDIRYMEKLAAAEERLKAWRNLSLAGRTGLFWYNNMDHSIENAFEVSKHVLASTVESQREAAPDLARQVLAELERKGVQGARAVGAPRH